METTMDLVKRNFIEAFEKLADEDFGLKGIVSLKFVGERNNILEVHFPSKEADPRFIGFLAALVFNKEAYDDFKAMGVIRIVLIYEQEKEFEELSIGELCSMV